MLAIFCLSKLVFFDESFVHTHMTRSHGRSHKGKRVHGRLKHRSARYTLIGAVGIDGLYGQWLINRAMSQKDFETYIETILIPALPPRRIVIWDNLNSHYSEFVAEAMRKAGHIILFQSAYSPDLNPIEKVWSKIKALVRGQQPRGAADLRQAVDWAWGQVTRNDIWGWFAHCLPLDIRGDQLALL